MYARIKKKEREKKVLNDYVCSLFSIHSSLHSSLFSKRVEDVAGKPTSF